MSNDINLLDAFAGDQDFSVLATDPGSLSSNSKTTTLIKGRRVPFTATFAGMSLPAYATLQSAYLHRVSVIDHVSLKQNGRVSKLVTGIFKPVKMDIEVVFDSQIVTLQNLLRAIVNRKVDADKHISEENFIATLEQLGIRFASGMNLFWQQFGSDPEGIAKLVDAFKTAGAVDAMSSLSNAGRIKECYQMPQQNNSDISGPEVTSFELSRASRAASMTGQGFLDLVDAVSENFKRIVMLRKQASIIRQEINAKAISESWTQDRIAQRNQDATALVRLSQQWATVWSGAQQRCTIDKKDPSIKTYESMFDPTSAPCGRFKMIVAGQEVAIDLWTNSVRANTSDSVQVSAPSDEAAADDAKALVWN
jgi:hypothetical protein